MLWISKLGGILFPRPALNPKTAEILLRSIGHGQKVVDFNPYPLGYQEINWLAALEYGNMAAGQADLNGQTLSRVRPHSGAVAGLSTRQQSVL